MPTGFLPTAAVGLLGLLSPLAPPRPAPPIAPVAAPIIATAASGVKGTMILVHGGGWAGPDRHAQEYLLDQPGRMLAERGWRVVSVDYRAGRDGLQDVLDAAGSELVRPSGGLLCLYGESAGGHLALLAAARLPAVDCVAAAGVPTDFGAYAAEAAASGDPRRHRVAKAVAETFGTDPEAFAHWEPARVAEAIDADVLMIRQADDVLVSADQAERFRAQRPTTQMVELAAGNPGDMADYWLHGSLSDAGRGHYLSSLRAFTDRAVAAHRAARSAARTRCAQVNRRLGRIGSAVLGAALRCLARRDAVSARAGAARAGRVATARLRGEVTPARAWAALRAGTAGRRALAALAVGRAAVRVHRGDPSVVTVRVRR